MISTTTKTSDGYIRDDGDDGDYIRIHFNASAKKFTKIKLTKKL